MSADSRIGGRLLPFVSKAGLTFGIYHGGVVESPGVLSTGKPDQPDEVNQALDRLQGDKQLLVRTFLRYTGKAFAGKQDEEFPDLARYACNRRKLNLVLSNWDCTGDMNAWARFIERAIDHFGHHIQCLQICEEPNSYDYPGDGRFEHGVEAVITGVKTARARILETNLEILTGFNSIPCFSQGDSFWDKLASQMDSAFLNALDYVGLNFYPDVAEAVRGTVEDTVEEGLVYFRETTLAQARIPGAIPIHVCENGWPTGPQRFYTRQAEFLEQVIRKIHRLSRSLNITGYGLFSLRDADTANPYAAGQFGIMRDDYSPKPAYETYRLLIQELGT